ncbi:hypothetical protein SAMN05443428_12113 [Caloramator quimbayensis]|uniref:Vitamin B12 dependent methionine synthase, activation domain n=1 Tax=Caloramator quimbayensis TaxID=1147123 RepID=A0A1T4Y3P5_9CLOT|nr:hypothetical protein [Caloramator quimbayensis]SKA96432.1 hypothetical protein SAMN05443428_12113 [Caloramator quimbayensis]
MYSFNDFKFVLDKNHVLKVVESYYKIEDHETASKAYDDLLNLLQKNIQPVGLFKIEDKNREYDFETIKNCSKILYCIITLGNTVTESIDEMFKKGSFLEGVLLDAMSSSLLFEYNSQMYSYLFDWAAKEDLGITCRIAPGDGEIPIEYQRDIVERIETSKNHGISVMKGNAINPSKSMSYIHGADKELERIKMLHSCKDCSNLNCCIREVKQRIQRPYKQ